MAHKTGYTYIRHNGTWVQPKNVLVKNAGTWTQCQGVFTKINGEWEQVWPSQLGRITLPQDSYNFDTTLNKTTAKQKIIVRNSGDYDLLITSITRTNATKFTVNLDLSGMGTTPSVGSPVRIRPGEYLFIEVSITSSLSSGTDSGSVSITALNSVVSSTTTKNIPINGSITVLSATCDLDKTTLAYATTLTKTTASQRVTIKNNGQENLVVNSFTLSTPNKFTIGTPTGLGTLPVTISVGSSKSFDVAITALTESGVDSGTITINHVTDLTGTTATKTVTLSAAITSISGEASFSPSSVTLNASITKTSARRTVVITNTGQDVLTVNSITATSPHRFTVNVDRKSVAAGGIGPTLPTTIAVGKKKEFDISMTAGLVESSTTGNVVLGLTLDVLGTSATRTINVSGTIERLVGDFATSTNSVNFEEVFEGLTTNKKTFTLSNAGQETITNIVATVVNPVGGQFTIGVSGTPSSLAPGASKEITVRLTADTGVTDATYSGSIIFSGTADLAGGTDTKSVTITGEVEDQPVPQFDADACNFDSWTTDKPLKKRFTIRNPAPKAPLNIISFSYPAWIASVEPQTATISAKGSATFTATIDTALDIGSFTGSIVANTLELGARNVATELKVEILPGERLLTTGTTWTVPKRTGGVVKAWIIGGGGGAGYSSIAEVQNSGGGGSSGGMVIQNFNVTSDETVSYSVGAGGRGGSVEVPGFTGLTISIRSTHFNQTTAAKSAYINTGSKTYYPTRGHLVVVLDPDNAFKEHGQKQFDTYESGTAAMVSYLTGLKTGLFVIIASWDAITIDAKLRGVLRDDFKLTQDGNLTYPTAAMKSYNGQIQKNVTAPWIPRTAHIVVAVKGGSSKYAPYEAILPGYDANIWKGTPAGNPAGLLDYTYNIEGNPGSGGPSELGDPSVFKGVTAQGGQPGQSAQQTSKVGKVASGGIAPPGGAAGENGEAIGNSQKSSRPGGGKNGTAVGGKGGSIETFGTGGAGGYDVGAADGFNGSGYGSGGGGGGSHQIEGKRETGQYNGGNGTKGVIKVKWPPTITPPTVVPPPPPVNAPAPPTAFVKPVVEFKRTTINTDQEVTVPDGVSSVEIELLGGGGGAGGGDTSKKGFSGYPGRRIFGTINVTPGDKLTFAIGSGGSGGAQRRSTKKNPIIAKPGGKNSAGYNGGSCGKTPVSGQGGGGGAGTSLAKNGTVVAVAGGGGGGGGAGNNAGGTKQGALANKHVAAQEGQSAANRDSDGPTAGAGGGGHQGGKAGVAPAGDSGASSGYDGLSLVPAGWTEEAGTNGAAFIGGKLDVVGRSIDPATWDGLDVQDPQDQDNGGRGLAIYLFKA